MTRRVLSIVLGAVVSTASLAAAPLVPPLAADVAAARVQVHFKPGCHTGYRFDDSGAVRATKSACLADASSAPALDRRWIPGRGVHFPITRGIWKDYVIRETPQSYLPGKIVVRRYDPAASRTVQPGLYDGWSFNRKWRPVRRATAWVNRTRAWTVSQRIVVNGQYYYRVESGQLAGQWVKAGDWPTSSVRMRYGPNPPTCAYRDVLTARRDYSQYPDTLLDTIYMLPSGYYPGDLVDTSAAGLNGGYAIRRVALADLTALRAAAGKAGVPLRVISAFRSYASQVATFNHWVAVSGYQQALLRSARAGHSEHQLGTTIDFTHAGAPWGYTDWGATPTGKWMASNAWSYGFVMTYPKGRSAVHCYDYEPWHYRYVGREMARLVKNSGLTLREWIWRRYGS